MKIFQTLFQLLVLHLIDETPNAPFPWWAHNLLTFEGSQKEGKKQRNNTSNGDNRAFMNPQSITSSANI